MLKAATRAGEISFDGLAKALANFQMHAVEKVARRKPLASLRLDFNQTQRGLIAATHDQIVSMCNDHFARRGIGI